MPVTLPTYVTAPPAARRTVRTIDLDSTGVWTSGRSEADTALAREAEEAERMAARPRRAAAARHRLLTSRARDGSYAPAWRPPSPDRVSERSPVPPRRRDVTTCCCPRAAPARVHAQARPDPAVAGGPRAAPVRRDRRLQDPGAGRRRHDARDADRGRPPAWLRLHASPRSPGRCKPLTERVEGRWTVEPAGTGCPGHLVVDGPSPRPGGRARDCRSFAQFWPGYARQGLGGARAAHAARLLIRNGHAPGANVCPRLGLWRSW